MNKPSNNTGNGVDTESTRDVLNRLDRTIRVLEGELAKPNPFQTRSQLMGQLREAKALKASLQTALDAGSLTLNQPLFNNKGMSTAIPGSFIDAVLKRAEATFSLFSNQFTIDGDFGPKPGNIRPGNFGPRFGPNFRPSNFQPPKGIPPTMFEAIARGSAFEQVTGLPGGAYPGLIGYIFGKDGTTPVQKAPGRPIPHKWPHTDGQRYVFADDLSEIPVSQGTKVPGTTKTYYDANPIDLQDSMIYDDGVYAGKLAIPPSATSVSPAQSAGSKLYIPSPGDPVKGSLSTTHVHNASASAAPFQYTVAANIPWVGSGSSHVFNTNGTALQKAAGVSVPGSSDATVYSEALGTLQVAPGVFVPGSGSRAGAGATARNKVYTSSVATNQLTWVPGADIPWDAVNYNRFNEQGVSQGYAPGNAYPGQTNTVFNTDFSQYAVAAGKEVPGSPGYSRTDPETADSDGIGPAEQVYNASLTPVTKTRGLVVPGQSGKVYTTDGAGATVTTVAVGDPVILPAAGQTSTTQVYDTNFAPLTKSTGVFRPNSVQFVYEETTPGDPATAVERDVSTVSSVVSVPDPNAPPPPPPPPGEDPPPGDPTPTIDVVHHTLRLLPGAPAVDFGGQAHLPYVFDPSKGTDPSVSFATKISAGQLPAALYLPGQTHADVSRPSAFLQDATTLFLAPDPVDGLASPVAWAQAAQAILDPGISSATQYKVIQNASDATGSKVTVQLQGTRSLMYAQGFGASTSTTSSSRSSGGFRNFMNDPRASGRWV